MIKTFKHKGIKKFYFFGDISGIQPAHKQKIRLLLARLDVIQKPEDMNLPGFDFHSLKGERKDEYSVSVNKNWRLTFTVYGADVYDVNYEDYH